MFEKMYIALLELGYDMPEFEDLETWGHSNPDGVRLISVFSEYVDCHFDGGGDDEKLMWLSCFVDILKQQHTHAEFSRVADLLLEGQLL